VKHVNCMSEKIKTRRLALLNANLLRRISKFLLIRRQAIQIACLSVPLYVCTAFLPARWLRKRVSAVWPGTLHLRGAGGVKKLYVLF
jgi:hypothetical protein